MNAGTIPRTRKSFLHTPVLSERCTTVARWHVLPENGQPFAGLYALRFPDKSTTNIHFAQPSAARKSKHIRFVKNTAVRSSKHTLFTLHITVRKPKSTLFAPHTEIFNSIYILFDEHTALHAYASAGAKLLALQPEMSNNKN